MQHTNHDQSNNNLYKKEEAFFAKSMKASSFNVRALTLLYISVLLSMIGDCVVFLSLYADANSHTAKTLQRVISVTELR